MEDRELADFNPNARTLAQCLAGLDEVRSKVGLADEEGIVTSKDPRVQRSIGQLKCTEVPAGFNKWILPFYSDGAATFYLSFGAPNTEVSEHSHDEGAGIRVILSGSIIYKGQELTAGDWMYLPARARYSFKVGPMGVGQFYCYQCCCGGSASDAESPTE
jgi:hypothetical protein